VNAAAASRLRDSDPGVDDTHLNGQSTTRTSIVAVGDVCFTSTQAVPCAQLAVIRRRLRERVRSTGGGSSERPFKPTGFVRRRHRRQRPIGSRCAILRHAGDALDENGVPLDRAVQRRRCALDERYSGRTSRRPASANLSASARGNIPHNQRTRNCGSSSSPRSAKGRASSRCPAKASAIA
jgi:hypothetical protein